MSALATTPLSILLYENRFPLQAFSRTLAN
jgi:hypothetical protein